MEKTAKQELLTGIVTVISIAILIISIIWGKQFSNNKEFVSFYIKFNRVNNLKIGNEISVRGVVVGSVKEISLKEDMVLVKCEIDKSLPVYSDAKAIIINKELMGGRMIILSPGKNGKRLKEGSSLIGNSPMGLTETMAKLGSTMEKLEGFIDNASLLALEVKKILPQNSLEKTINNITKNINTTLTTLKHSIVDIKKSANLTLSKTNTTIDSLNTFISNSNLKINQIAPKIDNALLSSAILLKNLNKKIDLLKDSTNSLGSLLTSDKMYKKLYRTIANIDSLVTEIKKDGVKTNINLW